MQAVWWLNYDREPASSSLGNRILANFDFDFILVLCWKVGRRICAASNILKKFHPEFVYIHEQQDGRLHEQQDGRLCILTTILNSFPKRVCRCKYSSPPPFVSSCMSCYCVISHCHYHYGLYCFFQTVTCLTFLHISFKAWTWTGPKTLSMQLMDIQKSTGECK